MYGVVSVEILKNKSNFLLLGGMLLIGVNIDIKKILVYKYLLASEKEVQYGKKFSYSGVAS